MSLLWGRPGDAVPTQLHGADEPAVLALRTNTLAGAIHERLAPYVTARLDLQGPMPRHIERWCVVGRQDVVTLVLARADLT